MIQIVTAQNRHLFHHALMEMHRQRKRVFIDELGWPLQEIAGAEIDAFDSPTAIYLIEMNTSRGEVLGSARLLPTEPPHLLSEVFPHLCGERLPRGRDVWEATRFCPAPSMPPGAPKRALLMRMIAAIIETALLFGVQQVTFVASAALAPLAASAGWGVTPLGPAHRQGRDRLRAFVGQIEADGLRQVRLRNGLEAPITRFVTEPSAQAA